MTNSAVSARLALTSLLLASPPSPEDDYPLDYAGQGEGEVDICVILLLNGAGVYSNEHLPAAYASTRFRRGYTSHCRIHVEHHFPLLGPLLSPSKICPGVPENLQHGARPFRVSILARSCSSWAILIIS
jgi:hypothetical protein